MSKKKIKKSAPCLANSKENKDKSNCVRIFMCDGKFCINV